MTSLTLLTEPVSRVKRDRLELLTAVIEGPGFDPLYWPDLMEIPPHHAVYAWRCDVVKCERYRRLGIRFCDAHHRERKASGMGQAAFAKAASPLFPKDGIDLGLCRVCPGLPASSSTTRLCKSHDGRWRYQQELDPQLRFEEWLESATPFESFGACRVPSCPYLAASPPRLCAPHQDRYYREGKPGGAVVPSQWRRTAASRGESVQVFFDDKAAFLRWCAKQNPVHRMGLLNLTGLHPLVKAEIKWGLNAHAQLKHRTHWDIGSVQGLANYCRQQKMTSLADFASTGETDGRSRKGFDSRVRMIVLEISNGLRCVYYSPADTKEAGFIETEHFGRRFPKTQSHFDLTAISQRWLRDVLWEYIAGMLRSAQCPRSRGPFDYARRACVELGAFLEVDAPQGGHDPTLLGAEHAQRFAADLLNRERHSLPSLGIVRSDGKPSTVTFGSRRTTFVYSRKIMLDALSSGQCAQVGLDHTFVSALPTGGKDRKVSRNPFTDQVARALADDTNLKSFAATFDPNDRGLRDIWEAIVATGRRCSEIIELRLDCTGRYRGLPMLWHDQTKVGNYNEGIRIPEYLYTRLGERRDKTLASFEDRNGRVPNPDERKQMALFPTDVRNPFGDLSISYGFFSSSFKEWVDGLNLGGNVIHQARHTMATKLLAAGASLAHIRRYLGQVSDRMAEHYAKVAPSDLDDLLSTVWVAGPGAAEPGAPLSGGLEPLSRAEAQALAIDLSRTSTPAEGGVCTYQPVVNGDACPWKMNCEGCDKFVLSGADLLYWRRKQEQWRSYAERAPTDEIADYLHQTFEPTARAIEGLENALAGLGLLEQALALDLRRPQDYYQRIWSINFRATDLAAADNDLLEEATS
ncbi:site-specific integrase [Streptomyces sp. Rer75]|uniref:site-specific integrase n=1 Tax=Streptomyces sp. Rer75 TaxID=2750011 RepID=UPI0015D0C7D9|nr:site-specific integrase [Streptomyces sp. Rer75]QLH24402.1 site-specific integrase [Streptomyces sp. Rer75]